MPAFADLIQQGSAHAWLFILSAIPLGALHGLEPGHHLSAIAVLSVQHATKRWSWFGTFARRAPYFSSMLIIAVGIYVGVQCWSDLSAHAVEGAVVTMPALPAE